MIHERPPNGKDDGARENTQSKPLHSKNLTKEYYGERHGRTDFIKVTQTLTYNNRTLRAGATKHVGPTQHSYIRFFEPCIWGVSGVCELGRCSLEFGLPKRIKTPYIGKNWKSRAYTSWHACARPWDVYRACANPTFSALGHFGLQSCMHLKVASLNAYCMHCVPRWKPGWPPTVPQVPDGKACPRRTTTRGRKGTRPGDAAWRPLLAFCTLGSRLHAGSAEAPPRPPHRSTWGLA